MNEEQKLQKYLDYFSASKSQGFIREKIPEVEKEIISFVMQYVNDKNTPSDILREIGPGYFYLEDTFLFRELSSKVFQHEKLRKKWETNFKKNFGRFELLKSSHWKIEGLSNPYMNIFKKPKNRIFISRVLQHPNLGFDDWLELFPYSPTTALKNEKILKECSFYDKEYLIECFTNNLFFSYTSIIQSIFGKGVDKPGCYPSFMFIANMPILSFEEPFSLEGIYNFKFFEKISQEGWSDTEDCQNYIKSSNIFHCLAENELSLLFWYIVWEFLDRTKDFDKKIISKTLVLAFIEDSMRGILFGEEENILKKIPFLKDMIKTHKEDVLQGHRPSPRNDILRNKIHCFYNEFM